MYIRRKIFSVLEIEGEERLFSTTEVEIQKEFASKAQKRRNKKANKADAARASQGVTDAARESQDVMPKGLAEEIKGKGAKNTSKIRISKKLKRGGLIVGGTALVGTGIGLGVSKKKSQQNNINQEGNIESQNLQR